MKSGFEDLPDPWSSNVICKHPQHDPPKMLVVPTGKQYRHICPKCGNQIILLPTVLKL